MLVDNLLPELKLKQSNILTMGDFNFDKNFRFSEFMEHTFSSKQIVSKVTRKYESLLDLAFLKVYPAMFYQVSEYRLSRASSIFFSHTLTYTHASVHIFNIAISMSLLHL
jgi:hypothetical protein